MSYCPKCGSKVREDMSFCPNCGAAIKAVQPSAVTPQPAPAPQPYRAEKQEKQEKREKQEKEERQEKREKTEKHEKREYGYVGSLVGGLILIFLGLMFYIGLTNPIGWGAIGAFFVILIGIVIILGAVYVATTAARRHPET
jgi:cation transport ATPase